MEIKISEKLNKKIKDFLNINFADYEIFYAFSSFLDTMCFVLKNEDNRFIGLKIRDNKIIEICLLRLCTTFFDNVSKNHFCVIDGYSLIRDKMVIFNNIYEKKVRYIDKSKEQKCEYYVNDSFLEVNEFLTFIKLYEFDNFKKEVNSNIDNEFMKTLQISSIINKEVNNDEKKIYKETYAKWRDDNIWWLILKVI